MYESWVSEMKQEKKSTIHKTLMIDKKARHNVKKNFDNKRKYSIQTPSSFPLRGSSFYKVLVVVEHSGRMIEIIGLRMRDAPRRCI